MEWIQTIIIAIVEGLTEFLPVSSTGHIIITQGLLDMKDHREFWNAFAVIIQFGAILSVVCLYWRKFFYPETMRTKGFSWSQAIRHFYLRLIIGVLLSVLLGFLLIEYM